MKTSVPKKQLTYKDKQHSEKMLVENMTKVNVLIKQTACQSIRKTLR